MPPAEPTPASLPTAWQRYFLATRPAFLTATLFGCFISEKPKNRKNRDRFI